MKHAGTIIGITRNAWRHGKEGVTLQLDVQTSDGKDKFGLGIVKTGTALPCAEGDSISFDYVINKAGYAEIVNSIEGITVLEGAPPPPPRTGGGTSSAPPKPGYRMFGGAGGYPLEETSYERRLSHVDAGNTAVKLLEFLDLDEYRDDPTRLVQLWGKIQMYVYFRYCGDDDPTGGANLDIDVHKIALEDLEEFLGKNPTLAHHAEKPVEDAEEPESSAEPAPRTRRTPVKR